MRQSLVVILGFVVLCGVCVFLLGPKSFQSSPSQCQTSPAEFQTSPPQLQTSPPQCQTFPPQFHTCPPCHPTVVQQLPLHVPLWRVILNSSENQQQLICRLLAGTATLWEHRNSTAGPILGVSFNIYLHGPRLDIVSDSIANSKSWDGKKTEDLLKGLELVSKLRGYKTKLLDVGANIGWFSIAAASHGYSVLAFEPMVTNEVVFRKSLCLNSSFDVEYYPVGLGDTQQTCVVFSSDTNIGDGFMQCRPVEEESKINIPPGYSIRSRVPIYPLDEVALDRQPEIGVVKIDIEGFEPRLLLGAQKFFNGTHAPLLVVAEFSPVLMVGSGTNITALELLQMWERWGYVIHTESWFNKRTLLNPTLKDYNHRLRSDAFEDFIKRFMPIGKVPTDDIFLVRRSLYDNVTHTL